MEKIIMLGTGNGFSFDLYNTCFVLQNDNQNLLVDTGGSIQIVKNLNKKGLKVTDIHNIFISHCHTDHLLGLFWILKNIAIIKDKYVGKLNIYCNDEVENSIKKIIPSVFPDKIIDILKRKINIIVLKDNQTMNIAGKNITFFDVKAKGNKLFGFETILNSNKKLIFLGDETCNKDLYSKIENSDYVMHETFCLDNEADIFHPYEKNHSTVKSVCTELNKLNIKNLILFHTEDSHPANKKDLYTKEAKIYFQNNVIVPNDLEEIILD